MKKKVFLETHNIKNRASGLGTFNYELIKGLSQLEFKNIDLTLNALDPDSLEDEFGKKFKYNKYTHWSRHAIFRNRKKYDLWHSVNQNIKVEPHHINNYLLTIHDVNFVEETSSDLNHKVNKLFIQKLKRATAITYISEFAKKQTHQYFDVPNIPEYIIYNGNPISNLLDTSSFITKIPMDKPFFYSIGDFIERKNFDSIVDMMRVVKDYNLIISGNNDKAYGQVIKKMIIDNNLENQVFLTGKVDELGKQFFLKNCSAFLFPSIREGFGLPPIEAMRFGKPVFLSDKTSLPEIGGEVAYYWNNFEPDYMKNIVFEGLNNYENNKQICEQKIIQRALFFDWKKAAGEYLDVYNKCLY
jgi:glycosyltransferase involved in cell wall biosynthesis